MGVSYLLDTHVVLWLFAEPARVPTKVIDSLADRDNALLVSAISAFEITTKARLGKLDAGDLPMTLTNRVDQIGATSLPVTIEHALFAGSMPWPHRDPFDRILVAQATIECLTLVTVDPVLASLPAPRVLTW